jgi:uncharacterized protein (UPF0332 family)
VSLAEDLVAQSRHLAELDHGRPKQANLRRAISAAYYGLFHLLIAEAVHRMVSDRPKGLQDRASRAFSHSEMRRVCELFRRESTPQNLRTLLSVEVALQLRAVAGTFVELQEERHSADYDLSARPSRATVLRDIQKAESAFEDWKAVRNTDEANVFLAALVFGSRWDK